MGVALAHAAREWPKLAAMDADSHESAPDRAQDRADIAASLQGDGMAYARLVRRYENLVAKQLWRFTRDPQVLEELAQDVFVEVYRGLGAFRGDAPFLHWLRRITTRVGYRHWAHKSRDRKRREALESQAAVSTAEVRPPETSSEAGELVFRLLEAFPADDRLVLTLFYCEQCDTREIAERMGWSRSLVKVRAFRARRKLRKLLAERGYGGMADG